MLFTVASGFGAPFPQQPHVVQIRTAQRRQNRILPVGNTGLPSSNFNFRKKGEKKLCTTADIIFNETFIN
jgi:hypothetical protein